MKKRSARSRHNRRRSLRTFRSNKLAPVIAIAALVISTIALISANQGKNQLSYSGSAVLSESDSGSGSSGSGSSDSGSGSGSSGSNDSGSSGPDDRSDDRSGSGSSGSGSSGSGNESNLRFVGPQPTNSFRPSPTPVRINEETRDELTGDRTRVQVDEGQTRLEQEIFEGGVRKRIEMRNENGRIRIRVKTKDALGNETEQRLELRPEEGLVRLRFIENGVEKDVKVRATNDRFVIEQEGFGATTNFPLTVDTETNTITVTTPLGIVNVQQLPATAIQNILAANILDKVESTELVEPENEQDKADPNKQVVFRIKGVKETRFLGLIKVDAPILAEVSAITGQTTFVDQPWYLNAFGFLFAK